MLLQQSLHNDLFMCKPELKKHSLRDSKMIMNRFEYSISDIAFLQLSAEIVERSTGKFPRKVLQSCYMVKIEKRKQG